MNRRLPVGLLNPALIGVPPPTKFMLELGVVANVSGLRVVVLGVVSVDSLVFFVAIDGGGTVIVGDTFLVGGLFALSLLGFRETGPLLLRVFGREHFLVTDIIDIEYIIIHHQGTRTVLLILSPKG